MTNNLKAERTLTADRIEELLKDDLHDRNLSPRARSDLAEALIELKALRSQSLSTQQPMGEPVAWTWKDAGGRVKVAPHDDWFEKPRNVTLLEAIPLYALHPNQESGE